MRTAVIILILFFFFVFAPKPSSGAQADELMVFCGAAFKRPIEEITESFQTKTGIKVNAIYGGIGTLFSQMSLTKQGDVFIAPSPDIMEKAVTKGLPVRRSIRNIGYVVPCINVLKGNPKNIRGLKDLARPGLKVAIANPEIVYIGVLSVELIEKNLNPDEKAGFRRNIVTLAEDFNKLATLLVLGQVDAIIGFHYLEGWYPDKVETVKLKSEQIQRIGSGQIGILTDSRKRGLPQKFIHFVTSDEATRILHKYRYFGSPEEAFSWIGAKKPIGGEYSVPGDWVGK